MIKQSQRLAAYLKRWLEIIGLLSTCEKEQHKTAIIAHGYMGQATDMPQYAKIYHDLGYNVLMPDARGHGKSEGDYIGFGWDERKDYLQWINRIIKRPSVRNRSSRSQHGRCNRHDDQRRKITG